MSKMMAKPKSGPAMSFRDLMQKVADADAAGGGKYITQQGLYVFALTGCIYKQGYTGHSIIAKFRVVSAKKNGADNPHEVGENVSTIFKPFETGENAEYKAGLFKSFILAMGGFDEGTVTDEEIATFGDNLVSDEQPMVGKTIECVAYEKTTEKDKRIIATTWGHISESEEEITAQAEGLKAGTWPEVF